MGAYEKITAVADNIRSLLGVTEKMGLDAMATNLQIEQVNINNAFTAIANKGGTIPTSQASGNLESAINSIPSGAELNFEVVGGTTQPTNPKENTIWVNTSTAITNWYFSATQPSNAVSGDVWFKIAASSNNAFNALKENTLMVYPVSAKQYVKSGRNSSWNSVNMSMYSNGQWLSGLVYLYNEGNQCTAVTSGWSTKGWDGGGDGDGSTSYDSSSIDIYCYNNSSNGRQIQGAITHNKINLSNITKIYAIGNMYNCPEEEGYKDSNVVGIAVMDSDEFLWSGEEGTPGYVVTYDCVNELGNFNMVIDVTKLTGSYYIAIYGFANSRHVGGTFSQIYCK